MCVMSDCVGMLRCVCVLGLCVNVDKECMGKLRCVCWGLCVNVGRE